MDKLIWYLIESSVILISFYSLYVLILRKETFFSLNRFYLIGTLIVSLIFPFLSFDFNAAPVVEIPLHQLNKAQAFYYDAYFDWTYTQSMVGSSTDITNEFYWKSFTVWSIAVLYFIGVIFCLSRTVWTFQWINRLINSNSKFLDGNLTVVRVKNQIAPFSFLKYVFVHDQMVGSTEYDHIIAHERTHVNQRHSIDLIFIQIMASVFWFNPVIWRLFKSLKTTHEYIADNNILNEGYSLVEYQTLLLRQLISNNSYGLVHNFNLSFIKKRITMMKNRKSGWAGKLKVALVLATSLIFGATVVQCNSALDDSSAILAEKSKINKQITNFKLPVIDPSHGPLNIAPEHIIAFAIAKDNLAINGTDYEVSEISNVIESLETDGQSVALLKIDKNQSMRLVRAVHTELRRANLRKVLYQGLTSAGERAEIPLLLPPLPGDNRPGVPQLPHIDDEYIAKTGIEVFKIRMGDDAGKENQKQVESLVRKHMQMNSSNYVVSAKFDNGDTFDSYLRNLNFIKEGFHQIYMERARQMFDKDFFDLDRDDETENKQYKAVRKGVPMAISIAEEL